MSPKPFIAYELNVESIVSNKPFDGCPACAFESVKFIAFGLPPLSCCTRFDNGDNHDIGTPAIFMAVVNQLVTAPLEPALPATLRKSLTLLDKKLTASSLTLLIPASAVEVKIPFPSILGLGTRLNIAFNIFLGSCK